MKLFVILIFCTAFFLHAAPGYSQEERIHLTVNNVKISDVLKEIESQTNYLFFYNHTEIGSERAVSLDAADVPLNSLLNQMFKNTDVNYKIVDKHIVLTKNRELANLATAVQGIVITGTVTDEAGEPMPGVNVLIKGTTTGVVTGNNGSYSITIPNRNAVLAFSFMGYTSQEFAVGDQVVINLVMAEDTQEIEEVVVVGYGTQKKVNLTGSVSSVSGDQLVKRPVHSPSALLQGIMPGVRVIQNDGTPSTGGTIQIRGYGTFSGAGVNPLIIIDGVPSELGGNIDPNTIESISVLKDAASAAIYGARAANGVILIKTKDGSESQGKTNVAYSYNYGIHSPTKMFDFVTNSVDYMNAFNTHIRNQNYGVDIPASQYPQEEIEKYRNATDRVLYPNYDWVGNFIKPAPTQMHNLTISGGKSTRYNFSLGYVDEKGTMEAFSYKKFNAQLNITSDVNSKLKIGGKANLSKGIVGAERSGAGNYFLCVVSQAPTYMPTLPDESGRYTWRAYSFEMCNWNPYLKLKEETSKTDNYYMTGQAWFDYEIIKGLHWTGNAAAYYTTSKSKAFTASDLFEQLYRPPHGNGYQLTSSLSERYGQSLYTNMQTTVTYTKKLGAHQIDALAGVSGEESNESWINGARNVYSSPATPELSAGGASGQTNGGGSQAWALLSFFGRVNYNFHEKYLFEANMRYDGTSRLSPETRWGAFPSFSVGWRISEESFMESSKSWLSNLKLRASWGILGNQNIGYYPYQAMLSFTGNYPFDGVLEQGVAQTALNNYNIRWEKTTTTNIALDITLFRKLSLSLDVYKKMTSDILRSAQVNALVAMSAPTINSGKMQNIGYDLDISYRDQLNNGFRFGIGAVISGFKNKLVKFGTREDGTNVLREEGRPYNTFYLLQADGIFQSEEEIAASPKQYGHNTKPGNLKFKNTNGDNVINNDDRVPMEKGVFPACTYGFTLNAEWKGIDFYAFFQGVAGQKVFITSSGTDGWGVRPFVQGTAPTKDQFANSWTPGNMSAKYVAIGDPVSYSVPSTYLLRDNSYMRLKAVQIGYSLPNEWIGKIGLSKLRIYFAGDNLLTFTKYKDGLDPERAGNGRYLQYPQNRVVSFGCNIEF